MNNTNSFLFSTNLSKNTELILIDLLDQATIIVKNLLEKEIAALYHVSFLTVQNIKSDRRWGHLA